MQKRLLKNGTTGSGIVYYIYEDADGSVFAETLCARHHPIARNADEFHQIPTTKLESMIYNAEMSGAR